MIDEADFGRMRHFAPLPMVQAQGYTAQITHLCATALRTYGELTLIFDENLPIAQRRWRFHQAGKHSLFERLDWKSRKTAKTMAFIATR